MTHPRILLAALAAAQAALAADELTLQLKWVTQGQFAGYYVAQAKGFDEYSPALRAQGGSWDATTLDRFLAQPQAAVPGTTMAFPEPFRL